MPAPEPRRPVLLFAALIVCSVAFAFALGHLSGRWVARKEMARFSLDEDRLEALGRHIATAAHRIREDEYIEVREAVERHRKQAPAEQHVGIDECLRVMGEHWQWRVDHHHAAWHIAEGK